MRKETEDHRIIQIADLIMDDRQENILVLRKRMLPEPG